MRDGEPKTIRLRDYRAPALQIRKVDLTVDINPGITTVNSRLTVQRQSEGEATLHLDGQELELVKVAVDGETLSANQYQLDEDSLTLFDLPDDCEVQIENRIVPEDNTALEGLYKSGAMYCTQCEAEGFRKITYYQDRPDVLASFTTTIIAGREYPVLLSNGNLVASETLADGRRKVSWHDPFVKPSYLFALVAGDLALKTDSFTTMSGRQVELRIYSEPHNIDQCDYAMTALKRSMRWDEERFGREYDLDIFMIVAVDDFNMGAMENKGLNIFNTSCVLAAPDTATDAVYQRVEGIVAHEYFHNWSGNRVTCRDWFQLSLKEGFTVFRDAQFSSEMNSRTMKRIEDVSFLRSIQFAEDAGPLRHPIRPDSYIEISNFYTPTIYEKGAEVIGMLHTILGPAAFRSGSDLYFERHDGQAATTNDFVAAMADASGVDLTQFERWYHQAGTPVVDVAESWQGGLLRLSFRQSQPDGQGDVSQPLHIPIALGFLAQDGTALAPDQLQLSCPCALSIRDDTVLLHLTELDTQLTVSGAGARPVVSMLRGFSAPVRVNHQQSPEVRAFLAVNDTDGFAAWDALQSLLVEEIATFADRRSIRTELIELFSALLDQALAAVTGDADNETRFMLAAKLSVPQENYLFEQFAEVDVDGICNARDALLEALSLQLAPRWRALFDATQAAGPYQPDAQGMSRRALHHLALRHVSAALSADELAELLSRQLDQADNLTDRRAVLLAAVNSSQLSPDQATSLLGRFYEQFSQYPLVVNQWLSIQAGAINCAARQIAELAEHEVFDLHNPNKVRALYSAFVQTNLRNFHDAGGSGYELIADVVLTLNAVNPQMASALAKPLTRWRRFTATRQRLMKQALEKIARGRDLSTDVFEVVTKGLAD